MTSAMGADGVESSNLGEDVEPEGGMDEIAEGVEDVSENRTMKETEKDGGLLVASPINETMTISENGGTMGIGFASNFNAERDSDLEMEVGSEEGDDILCDVCKIWRRSHQWKEHLASRCHQRNSKERRREQQRQNEQGRVRGELLEVEDRIARLNLVETGN